MLAWKVKISDQIESTCLICQMIAGYRFKESGQAPLPPILDFYKNKRNSLIWIIGQLPRLRSDKTIEVAPDSTVYVEFQGSFANCIVFCYS